GPCGPHPRGDAATLAGDPAVRSRGLTCALALTLVASAALAYAPHAGYVLHLSLTKRARQRLDAIRVVVNRTDMVSGLPAPSREVTVTLRAGGRFREEWTDTTGKHARVSDGREVLVVDGE